MMFNTLSQETKKENGKYYEKVCCSQIINSNLLVFQNSNKLKIITKI
ncbi:unnamed protein product [Paramecium sonneborni]|uniref:Uncharacterized protein n=1 Tax=Paramecium sonneborni TaxID=65129 RepID=A0A8S1QV07_9CILI|nr:unnamed protein product [Paramecium sonneborni]